MSSVFTQATEEEDIYGWDDLEDLFEEDPELSIMEHLLYGYYLEDDDDYENVKKVPYEPDEWMELWREYIEIDKPHNAIWSFTFPIQNWDQVELILENLENLKEEDAETFHKALTSNFVSCFLHEIIYSTLGKNGGISDKNKKSLVKWMKKHITQEMSQDDFWRVLAHFETRDNGYRPRIYLAYYEREFSQMWRKCCQKPIYVSFQEEIQRNTYLLYTDEKVTSGFGGSLVEDEVECLLDFCDGVIKNENYRNGVFLKELMENRNKELLYRCLKKNLVNQITAKETIEVAAKEEYYEAIPLLMLKVHGEWKEGKTA